MTTWNPADAAANYSFSGGNLIATIAGGNGSVRSTTSKSSGKPYFEVTATSVTGTGTTDPAVAIADATFSISATKPGQVDAHSCGYERHTPGFITANSAGTAIVCSTFTDGDVIGVATDVPNHLVYFSLNGVWQNSADPVLGTGGVDYITTSPIFAAVYLSGLSATYTANFGATAFSNSPPSGFSAWDVAASADTTLFTKQLRW